MAALSGGTILQKSDILNDARTAAFTAGKCSRQVDKTNPVARTKKWCGFRILVTYIERLTQLHFRNVWAEVTADNKMQLLKLHINDYGGYHQQIGMGCWVQMHLLKYRTH